MRDKLAVVTRERDAALRVVEAVRACKPYPPADVEEYWPFLLAHGDGYRDGVNAVQALLEGEQ